MTQTNLKKTIATFLVGAALGGSGGLAAAPKEIPAERPIADVIQGKSALERANLKAARILEKTEWGEYTLDDIRVEIQSIELIDGGVQVFARAWKDGEPMGFGSDGSVEIERFKIYNPPVMIPDGTKRLEQIEVRGRLETTESDNFVEDPEAALRHALAHTISVSGKIGTPIVAGKVGNTTSTFYPDANPESTSVDGFLFFEAGGGSSNWVGVRGNTTGTADDTNTLLMAAVQGDSPNWGSLTRSVMVFDTSSIADTDTVSAATISFYGRAGADVSCGDTAQTRFNLTTVTTAGNTSLASGDYNVTNYGSTDLITGDTTTASWSTGAYNDKTLNASGSRSSSSTSGRV